jgi:hypothetical protein
MQVWGATATQLADAAYRCGLVLSGPHGGGQPRAQGRSLICRLKLGPVTGVTGSRPYQRRSLDNRQQVAVVCWHGHRDWMREVYRVAPDARIKTALADYRGAVDFEARYRSTQDAYGDVWCECGQMTKRGWIVGHGDSARHRGGCAK